MAAVLGAFWFTLHLPRFDQSSLSTYNGIGVVTIEGVIAGPPNVRDTYINLRVTADRLTTPIDLRVRSKVSYSCGLRVPPSFTTAIACA